MVALYTGIVLVSAYYSNRLWVVHHRYILSMAVWLPGALALLKVLS